MKFNLHSMECVVGLSHAPVADFFRRSVTFCSKTCRIGRIRAKVNDDNDPLLQTAINSASLRYQETHRTGNPIFLFVTVFVIFLSFRNFIE